MSDILNAGVEDSPERSSSSWNRFARRFRSQKIAMASLIFIVLVVLAGALAPWIAPFDPAAIDVANRYQPPGPVHWLGTDDLGRDVVSRLLHATRFSLIAATTATVVAVVIGTPLGLIAGYVGGRWDAVLGRLADAFMSLPTLLIAIGVIAALGPGLINAMVALGLAYAPRLFRIVRGAASSVRQETYIEAAISAGASPFRIVRRHLLPNVLSPLIVELSLMMAIALLIEASLSFLGLGVVPPDASWGSMLSRAFNDIRTAPFLIYWPGIAIALTTLAFNLLGDGLRDSFGRETRTGKETK